MATAANIKVKLKNVDEAIDRVMLGQSYLLDTGQTRQTVTRADLDKLMAWQEKLETDLQLAERRENGGNMSRGVF